MVNSSRHRCGRRAWTKPARAGKLPSISPALLRQLAGMGNNLNQIARQVNAGGAAESTAYRLSLRWWPSMPPDSAAAARCWKRGGLMIVGFSSTRARQWCRSSGLSAETASATAPPFCRKPEESGAYRRLAYAKNTPPACCLFPVGLTARPA